MIEKVLTPKIQRLRDSCEIANCCRSSRSTVTLKLVDEARIVADGKDFIAMSFALLSYVNKEILFIVDGPDEVETMERLENLVRAFERNSGDTMPN